MSVKTVDRNSRIREVTIHGQAKTDPNKIRDGFTLDLRIADADESGTNPTGFVEMTLVNYSKAGRRVETSALLTAEEALALQAVFSRSKW